MATFSRTDPAASFSLPDALTFQQKLAFSGEFSLTAGSRVERAWAAAKTLITGWQCAALPDFAIDFDELNEWTPEQQRDARRAIVWAASEALIAVQRLDSLPKDSSNKSSPL